MPWKPDAPNKIKPKRESSAHRGYGGKWRNIRKRYLMAHPLCVKCSRPAEVVDHIIPHRGDDSLMWSEDNFQSLCKRCHDRKTGTHDCKPIYKYNFQK